MNIISQRAQALIKDLQLNNQYTKSLPYSTYNITFSIHRLLSWLPLLSISIRSLFTVRQFFFLFYLFCELFESSLYLPLHVLRRIFHVCTLLLFLCFLLKWEQHCTYKFFHDNIHELLIFFFFIFHYTLQNALLKLHISRISLNFLEMDYHC
jgi:hypothetical protein